MAALVVPTNQSAFFDGVPWASPVELIAVVIVGTVLSFASLRDVARKGLESMPAKTSRRIIAGVLALLVVKAVVYIAAPISGQFEVCYRDADPADLADPCFPTFEPHPYLADIGGLYDRRSTSVEEITFVQRNGELPGLSNSTWRLPFVNSFRYDSGFWPWVATDKNIQIFPFRAEFRGPLRGGDQVLILKYVGEGALSVGETTTPLPSSYDGINTVRVPVSSDSPTIALDYAFLRTQTNEQNSSQPYATLRMTVESNGVETAALAELDTLVGLLNITTDTLTLLLVALCLIPLWRRRVDIAWSAILAVVVGGSMWFSDQFDLRGVVPIEPELGVLILLTIVLLLRHRSPVRAFGAYLVVAWILVRDEFLAATGVVPQLNDIFVRLRGNDYLVYESFSRLMLTDGFLRGGESVYHFQPGIRYYFHVLGLLFGDSGVLVGLVSVVLMGTGILFLLWSIRSAVETAPRLVLALAVCSLLLWWSSSVTTQFTVFGLSEPYTWIAILFIGGLMSRSTSRWNFLVIVALAASATFVRPNQGLAMVAVTVIAALRHEDGSWSKRRTVAIASAIYFGLLSWVPVHNLVYGGEFAIQPTGAVLASQLTWAELTTVFSNESTQSFLLTNLQAVLYVPWFIEEIYSYRLALAVAGFGTVVVALMIRDVATAKAAHRAILPTMLAWAVVVTAQIVPYLKFTAVRYHPSMVMAIHLTAVVMGLVLMTDTRRRRSSGGQACN